MGWQPIMTVETPNNAICREIEKSMYNTRVRYKQPRDSHTNYKLFEMIQNGNHTENLSEWLVKVSGQSIPYEFRVMQICVAQGKKH